VSRINVLVAATSVDTKATTIAERVAARPDMNLVGEGVVGANDVDPLLDADPSLVQIAIVLLGKPEHTRKLAERWIAKRRGLVVMLADLVDDIIRIEGVTLRDPRLDGLLTVLRQLVEEVGQEADAASTEPVPRRSAADDSILLKRVMEWVDATLLRVLRAHHKSIGDHPLALSHALVEALLVERVGPVAAAAAAEGEIEATTRAALADAVADACDAGPLGKAARRLSLTALEFQAVLLTLAPELDATYQLVYGVLNDDMSRRTPTLALLCQILGPSPETRQALTLSQGLSRWRLIEHGGAAPRPDEPLYMDPPVVNWLLGDADALTKDPRLAHVLRSEPWPGATWLKSSSDVMQIKDVATLLRRHQTDGWIVLSGEDVSGIRAAAEAAVGSVRARPLRVLLGPLAASGDQGGDVAIRLARAVTLTAAVPIVDAIDANGATDLKTLAALLGMLTDARHAGVLIARDLERVVNALPSGYCPTRQRGAPTLSHLAAIYGAAAREQGLSLDSDECTRLAHSFRLPFEAVDAAVRLAALERSGEHSSDRHAALLTSAFRRVAAPDLPSFATRIDPAFDLDDIVLPTDRRAQLDEIIAHIRYAPQVLHVWGFDAKLPYGRGVAALFSGPSGCGKSMAAQAIAGALHTQTYVLDLSRVVSKYIGESEKNIDLAFRDAQRAGAVLQIDEAEAMFGKRSEVKDAHDRYANIEVAYLLQRMEAFDGVAILTTNLRENLDPAFLRRLRFVVDFPRPDAEAREAIWRRGLPADAPFHDLNIRFLARRLELTGANIRQITIRAAFLAAAERVETIEMRHVMAATKSELIKLGMSAAARDVAEFEAAQAAARVA
jgi:hypothetical protein